jgi:acetaldehyde dehydrogenase (acetylating)
LRFGLEKPVFRILANTMGALGAVGLTTGLMPALTLGSGGIGGSISGDNITTTHLLNIKRLAYEITTPPAQAMVDAQPQIDYSERTNGPSPVELETIVRRVVEEVLGQGTQR